MANNMTNNEVKIPPSAWQRAIGLGWENCYTVRYPSNLDDGPWHGATLGGFGAGCIGRSPRGDFNLWHLDGGEHTFHSIPACQFSVFEQVGEQRGQAYALSTQPPEDGSLSSWEWYPGANSGNYYALYPRSWLVYENVFQTQLTCEQFSPIWANNYQESSYPIAIFKWTVHNPTDQPVTISIMLTWQNIVGWFTNYLKTKEVRIRDDGSPVYDYQPKLGESTGNLNQWIEEEYRVGCILDRVRLGDSVREEEGQWTIASITNPSFDVFHHTRWHPNGDGREIWEYFSQDGSLPDIDNEMPAEPGEQIAVAMAIRFTVRPGKTRQIPFILAWDFPVTEFADGINYYRRYTDFYGRNGRNSWSMIRTALKHYDTWKERIEAWQEPILSREDLPDWMKMALFNELYDLTSGGTLWTAADERDPVGQFGVLECLDYRWYESLDVRLYGSFPVVMFWPRLDKAVLEAYARAIATSDDTTRIIGYNQAEAVRKIANATPHDLGAPNEHPWEKTNYTSYQDCNLWKDLPCDFVLQVYRYFVFTGQKDLEFLEESFPSIVKTLDYLKGFDLDGDGIPENSGAPDQTFDDWRLQGVSAYCGGLWLAALQGAIAICDILLKNRPEVENSEKSFDELRSVYQDWYEQASKVYQEKLWNGEYYRLDSESNSDVVMTDQLCGQFYSRLLGLPDIVPDECVKSALKTVYDSCFVKFNDFQSRKYIEENAPSFPILPLGAANGVKPDGSPENPNATHPLEVWTGINFGVAAFMWQMGMKDEALQITEAVVKQIYNYGLQFRTPEAITAAGTFRASYYLRGMAIWAIYRVM